MGLETALGSVTSKVEGCDVADWSELFVCRWEWSALDSLKEAAKRERLPLEFLTVSSGKQAQRQRRKDMGASFLPCQVQQHSATQTDHLPIGTIPEEGIEQPHNNPPPPAPPHAAVAQCPKHKDLKPREKKRLICRSRPGQSSGNREIGEQYNQLGVSLEFDEDFHSKADQRTTVMIKNIPNKFSRDMLIGLLDEHCAKENEKAQLLDSAPSQYDFVYLPIDFKNGCNLGYAFVNFTTAAAARRLYGAMHRHEWKVFGSKKISHVCYARIQGRKALVNNFKNSNFRCDTDEFFPAVLSPPRDGATSLPSPIPVGRRWKGVPR
ncbi:unnamed protein product [Musa acuminata subsp. malaccensis]|uniref:(wild Malaysian banana) hypothetical protein n=1 Tax=Musa acuminata subsp. malaccensis TaxID=214687 RepID=A0A804J1A8_MUSAM|nr:PREDICTED: uncharacterized protein LOC103984362 [Musa acuminata subsp. malaccensis]CAG1837617.1 unnamed protein product [Musa acuminata subsp. malaccensis]